MAKLTLSGASGQMCLLEQHDLASGELRRLLKLEASADGKGIVLIEQVLRPGGRRDQRIEITLGDLIACIRAHGEIIGSVPEPAPLSGFMADVLGATGHAGLTGSRENGLPA